MSLTKETTIDKIEIIENGIIQIRQVTRILEDSQQLSQSYHRWSLFPGQNIADQEDKVQSVCSAVWTPEVITAYNQGLTNQQLVIEQQ